jgi:tRNA(fMet)-specific endonuclease VapC
MTVLAYDHGAAAIVKQFRSQRLALGAMDAKIAAIVLSRNAILVTRNVGDFRKVPGLRIEDWATEGVR